METAGAVEGLGHSQDMETFLLVLQPKGAPKPRLALCLFY